MPKSVISRANPTLLKWCREHAHLDIARVAKLENLSPKTIANWERGKGSPSLSRLRRLAVRYRRPLLVFYLKSVPTEFNLTEIRDFRTLRNARVAKYSPELVFAIRSAKERQEWAGGYLQQEGASPVSLVGSLTSRGNVPAVASHIRGILGITIDMQAQCRGNHAAFAMWRERIESLGVLVLQAKGIDVEEMRGLALVHRFAPAILINSRDAVSARLFTLLHEFVHLMIGESAITGGEIFDSDIHAGTEKFCNQVAASTLIPADDLLNWLSSVGHVNGEAVSTLSRRYNVSQPVIALRLSEMNRIDSDLVSKIIAIALSHRPAQEKKEIKIKPFRLAIGRNGKYFSRLAHSAFEQGEIHGGQLSALLGLKLQHLPALENALYRSSGDIESE